MFKLTPTGVKINTNMVSHNMGVLNLTLEFLQCTGNTKLHIPMLLF